MRDYYRTTKNPNLILLKGHYMKIVWYMTLFVTMAHGASGNYNPWFYEAHNDNEFEHEILTDDDLAEFEDAALLDDEAADALPAQPSVVSEFPRHARSAGRTWTNEAAIIKLQQSGRESSASAEAIQRLVELSNYGASPEQPARSSHIGTHGKQYDIPAMTEDVLLEKACPIKRLTKPDRATRTTHQTFHSARRVVFQ